MSAPNSTPKAAPPNGQDSTAPRSDYCLFERGGVRFAVATRLVREILEGRPYSPVPRAPSALAGALNLRGEILPLVRLDRFLGVETRPIERTFSILLLQDGDLRIAAVVDTVLSVRHLAPWEIRRGHEEEAGTMARGSLSIDGVRTTVIDGERILASAADTIVDGFRAHPGREGEQDIPSGKPAMERPAQAERCEAE